MNEIKELQTEDDISIFLGIETKADVKKTLEEIILDLEKLYNKITALQNRINKFNNGG